ncbi:MAG: imidazole glycerol phosphate synthase subunit HisH [Gammaproteobacteria bacterium]|nr:imidazole glycerol phosphate synthase subunit HisH [Gammaproteobacteria bacterium]
MSGAVAVVNLGNSNITSVINALNHLNIQHVITQNSKEILSCEKILLPGVGSFGFGVKALHDLNLFTLLQREVIDKHKPILGICLGMQLLFSSSDETKQVDGLNILDGHVCRLPISDEYKIPRIGWGESTILHDFLGIKKDESVDFYYVHSFSVKPNNDDIISIKTGNIVAAVQKQHVFGCQFHPEKSYNTGLEILREFSLV